MKLWKVLLFALFAMCVSLPLPAQNITFSNTDGMFNGTGLSSGDLGLSSSALTGVSGFMGDLFGYNTTGSDLGTLSFTSGPLMSGTMVPLAGQTSTFGPGGTFKVVDTYNGGYGGFTFKGVFSASEWACEIGINCHQVSGTTNEWKGEWVFQGTLAAGTTLTIDGQKFTASTPGTIQITASGPGGALETVTENKNGSISFADAGGTTRFGGQFQISPEPGTLALFGTGLVAVGMLRNGKRFRRLTGSTSVDS